MKILDYPGAFYEIKNTATTPIQYQKRLVVSGNIFELYEYSKPVLKNYSQASFCKKTNQDNIFEQRQRIDNLWRTQTSLRRLINSNTDTLNKFITLTFAKNIKDVEIANYEFKKFKQRLCRGINKPIKYITVIEFQSRGAVHYHMLSDIPFTKANNIADIWGNGFIKINRINNVSNVGAYVSKYLTKETSEKLFNKKKYFHSNNLNKPREIIDEKIIDMTLDDYRINIGNPIFSTEYGNDYRGSVKYSQFRADSPI
jgi:hypothetical protein